MRAKRKYSGRGTETAISSEADTCDGAMLVMWTNNRASVSSCMGLDLRASEPGSRPRTTAERHDASRQDVKVE